jgi:SNF2 family DNA or RNA helicase
MKYITLRRTKDQELDGKPILHLPPCKDIVERLELSPPERALYDAVQAKAKAFYDKLASSNRVVRGLSCFKNPVCKK